MWSRNQTVSILVLAVVLVALTEPVLAQPADQVKARVFIQTAETAKSIAIDLIEKGKLAGKDVSLSESLVKEGISLLDQAKLAYDKGDYDSAATQARNAQVKFREAIRKINGEKQIEEQDTKPRLLEAVQRARERIEKVRKALSNLTDVAQDLRDQIKSKLNDAESLLNECNAIFQTDMKNASEAARKLAQAEKLVSEAFVATKNALKEPNKHRVEALLKTLQKEISRLNDDIEKLKRGTSTDDLKEKLAKADGLLSAAKDKILNDDVAGAFRDIGSARELVNAVKRELGKRSKP